jgi:hypothetical protein
MSALRGELTEEQCFRMGVKNLEASYRHILRTTGETAMVPEQPGDEALDNEDMTPEGLRPPKRASSQGKQSAASTASEPRPQSQTMSVYAVLSPTPAEGSSAAPHGIPEAYRAGSGGASTPASSFTAHQQPQPQQPLPQLAFRGLPPPPYAARRASGDRSDADAPAAAVHKSDWVHVQYTNAQGLPSPTASSHSGGSASGRASPRSLAASLAFQPRGTFAGGSPCVAHAHASSAPAFARAYPPPPQESLRQCQGQGQQPEMRESNRLPPLGGGGFFTQQHGRALPASEVCMCRGEQSWPYHIRGCKIDRM